MTREAVAERGKLATQIYRECVNRAYPEAEVTFNHSRCVELLAVCANEALERIESLVVSWRKFGATLDRSIKYDAGYRSAIEACANELEQRIADRRALKAEG